MKCVTIVLLVATIFAVAMVSADNNNLEDLVKLIKKKQKEVRNFADKTIKRCNTGKLAYSEKFACVKQANALLTSYEIPYNKAVRTIEARLAANAKGEQPIDSVADRKFAAEAIGQALYEADQANSERLILAHHNGEVNDVWGSYVYHELAAALQDVWVKLYLLFSQ